MKPKEKKSLSVVSGAVLLAVSVIVIAFFVLHHPNTFAGLTAEQHSESEADYEAPVFAGIHASSTLEMEGKNTYFGPLNLIDRDMNTAWREGKEGSGTGEWIELVASEKQLVSGLRFVNGYLKSEESYTNHERPKTLNIVFDDNSSVQCPMQDVYGGWQKVEFEPHVFTKTIRIMIDSVYEGDTYSDCCITELEVF